MIPDRLLSLLTAYVDGELTARQRKAVLRLLHRSPQARDLLHRLRQDARQLRALPHHRPHRDLTFSVVQAIAAQRIHPGSRPSRTAGFPAWAGLAAAASVLLVIGFASYVYFSVSQGWMQPQGVAQHQGDGATPVDAGGQDQLVSRPPQPLPETPDRPEPARPEPPASEQVAGNTEPKTDPEDPRKPHDLLGSGDPFDPRIDLTLPRPRLSSHVVRDLGQGDALQKLQGELQKDPGYRLELFCLDSTRALERLQAAARTASVRLLLDADAQLRLKHKMPTSYVLFLEDVTPGEVAGLLQHLGIEDRKLAAGVFGKLLVNPLAGSDEKELAKLLAVDASLLAPRKKTEIDPRKPLTQRTEEEVIQSLAGQGGVPRPGTSKDSKVPERVALTVSAHRRPGPSREVQQFFDARKEPRPGTVQILLVLRIPNG